MTIQMLSPSQHHHLRWKRADTFFYAASHNLVSLAAAEISKAALAFPLAFTCQNGHWALCAMLGFIPGQNLYVTPTGHWVGDYVPATLCAHPFHLGWEGTAASLCIDEDSELVVADSSGEDIFSKRGLSEAVEQIWSFLSATADSLLALEKACGVLASAGVIEPWTISLQGTDGTRDIEGLHRINEAALVNLDDTVANQLRRAGLLGVAYAQVLSMGNFAQLADLARSRFPEDAQTQIFAQSEAERPPPIYLPDDSTIDWDWSKIGR